MRLERLLGVVLANGDVGLNSPIDVLAVLIKRANLLIFKHVFIYRKHIFPVQPYEYDN
jgi:hypothetical protein